MRLSLWQRRLIRWGYENQDNERKLSYVQQRRRERERERRREGRRTQFISAFDGVEEVRQGCVSRIRAGIALLATVAQLHNLFLVSQPRLLLAQEVPR
jgi:hypothetical protein